VETTTPPLTSVPALDKPAAEEKEARAFVAPQWKLIWWKFRKHKLALISALLVGFIYFVALFAEFLAPFSSLLVNLEFWATRFEQVASKTLPICRARKVELKCNNTV